MPDPDDVPDNLMAELVGMDAGVAAKALVDSIGEDGHPSAKTIELLKAIGHRLAEAPDERKLEAYAYASTLIGCLAQVAAQAKRELEKRGVTLTWPE
jgi:hypothetical protein